MASKYFPLCCLQSAPSSDKHVNLSGYGSDEKLGQYGAIPSSMSYSPQTQQRLTVQEAASRISYLIQNAQKSANEEFVSSVNDIVQQAGGWSERIAVAILNAIRFIIEEGKAMGPALGEAYEKATEVAEEVVQFTKDHPYYTAAICTVIAIGILVLMESSIVELIGFGARGVIRGSWAADWQSLYGGAVEAGSLFSYLQRLGMVWRL